MKKILTLLIAVTAFSTLHAQSREENRRIILGDSRENRNTGGRNDRDVVLGRDDDRQYPRNGSYDNNRQNQIDQINREYDNKIYSIRNNPNLSNQEKERTIRQLERDRQARLARVNGRYDERDRRYDNDRSDRNDRYERRGNGHKKGWDIGKGNPHRDGGKDKGWKKNGKNKKNRN